MAKLLKKVPCCWSLDCRGCGAAIPAPSGSLFWTREEIELHAGRAGACVECGTAYTIPKP